MIVRNWSSFHLAVLLFSKCDSHCPIRKQELQEPYQLLPNRKEEGERPRSFPKAITGKFSHLIGQSIVTWPHLAAREAGKWVFILDTNVSYHQSAFLLLQKRRMTTWGQGQSLPQVPTICHFWNTNVQFTNVSACIRKSIFFIHLNIHLFNNDCLRAICATYEI